jgi:peptidoglycan hydrolase-like protein with peptidoglycan-binding domain
MRRRKRQIVTAALLSGSVALAGQSLFAQTGPGGGPSGPTTPGQTGPTVPQPGPSSPRQTQPTLPGQPAPGPQTDPMPGQTAPIPGQRGTIPERVEQPGTGTQGTAGVSSDNIKKAQEALKARGLNPGTDGKMDARTQQALREFQKANNLPVTGVLDQRTAQQLGVTLEGGQPQSGPAGTTTQPGSGSGTTQPGQGGTGTTPRPGGSTR